MPCDCDRTLYTFAGIGISLTLFIVCGWILVTVYNEPSPILYVHGTLLILALLYALIAPFKCTFSPRTSLRGALHSIIFMIFLGAAGGFWIAFITECDPAAAGRIVSAKEALTQHTYYNNAIYYSMLMITVLFVCLIRCISESCYEQDIRHKNALLGLENAGKSTRNTSIRSTDSDEFTVEICLDE